MKLTRSANLRIVSNNSGKESMVYHKIFGNPRIFNHEALAFLTLFANGLDTNNLASFVNGSHEDVLKELLDINYVFPENVDEQSIVDRKKEAHLALFRNGETIDHIGLSISNTCNFGCPHCIFFDRNRERSLDFRMMTWDTAKKSVDAYLSMLRRNGRKCGRIVFGNAEPLMNWHVLRKTLDYCEDVPDIVFEYAINTNLSLLTKEIALTLKRCRVKIATSLDGLEEANDKIRLTQGGAGTFTTINKKIDLLESIEYPLEGISITITSKNYSLIDSSIIDYALNRGMTRVACDFDLVNLQGIPVEQRVSKIMGLKNYANKRGMVVSGTWSRPFKNLMRISSLSNQDAFCAAAAGRMIVFDDDGSVKVCGYANTRIGHIDTIDDLFSEGGIFYQLIENRVPGNCSLCKGCDIEGICAGQCLTTVEAANGRETLLGDMCGFYRKITDALIQDSLANYSDIGVSDLDESLSASIVKSEDKFNFACSPNMKCSQACCSNVRILLPPYDLFRIRKRLSQSYEEFLARYAQVSTLEGIALPVISLRMRDDERRSCPFYTDQGCAIYSDRPSICRYYPVIPKRKLGLAREYQDYLFARWHNCLGLRSAKEWSVGEWRDVNEISTYDSKNEKWKELISTFFISNDSGNKQQLSMEQLRHLFFLASYDIERLKEHYIWKLSQGRAKGSEVETKESTPEDDMSLTLHAWQWLTDILKGKEVI